MRVRLPSVPFESSVKSPLNELILHRAFASRHDALPNGPHAPMATMIQEYCLKPGGTPSLLV